MSKKGTITQLGTSIAQLQNARRNLLASLECTDSHLQNLERRVAALEDRLCTQQCPSGATSRHMSANNDSNQSDSSDSVGRSADLRTRIAALQLAHMGDDYERDMGECPCGFKYSTWPELAAHQADAVIRELGLQPHLAKRIINGKPDQWVRRFTTDWEIVDE